MAAEVDHVSSRGEGAEASPIQLFDNFGGVDRSKHRGGK